MAQAKQAKKVGEIILEQMGGYNRLAMMLGINKMTYTKNGVAFGWPNRQRSKGNYVEITLDPDDTYTIEFFNLSIRGKKSVKKHRGVYAEDLVRIFEGQTGWYLRLGSLDQLAPGQKKATDPLPLDVQKTGAQNMNDKTLRSQLVRLAHANPEMRPHILPLITAGKKGEIPEAFKKNIEKMKAKSKDKKDEDDDGDKDEKNSGGKKGLPPEFLKNIKKKKKAGLRGRLVRLARAHPELQSDLLPLLTD